MSLSYQDAVVTALMGVGSHERGAVLASIDPGSLELHELRGLLSMYWPMCDAVLQNDAEVIRQLFAMAAPVTDRTVDEVPRPGTLIYRAHLSNTPAAAGLSWTTSFDVADWFAGYLLSPRAAFVGIPQGGSVMISAASCDSVLGYFEGREEWEVIPGAISDLYIAEGQCGQCLMTRHHKLSCSFGEFR